MKEIKKLHKTNNGIAKPYAKNINIFLKKIQIFCCIIIKIMLKYMLDWHNRVNHSKHCTL